MAKEKNDKHGLLLQQMHIHPKSLMCKVQFGRFLNISHDSPHLPFFPSSHDSESAFDTFSKRVKQFRMSCRGADDAHQSNRSDNILSCKKSDSGVDFFAIPNSFPVSMVLRHLLLSPTLEPATFFDNICLASF